MKEIVINNEQDEAGAANAAAVEDEQEEIDLSSYAYIHTPNINWGDYIEVRPQGTEGSSELIPLLVKKTVKPTTNNNNNADGKEDSGNNNDGNGKDQAEEDDGLGDLNDEPIKSETGKPQKPILFFPPMFVKYAEMGGIGHIFPPFDKSKKLNF